VQHFHNQQSWSAKLRYSLSHGSHGTHQNRALSTAERVLSHRKFKVVHKSSPNKSKTPKQIISTGYESNWIFTIPFQQWFPPFFSSFFFYTNLFIFSPYNLVLTKCSSSISTGKNFVNNSQIFHFRKLKSYSLSVI